MGAKADGSLIDHDGIQRTVKQHSAESAACISEALKTDPKTEGKVTIKFDVSDTGSVSAPHYESDKTNIKDSALIECLTDKLRSWKFPAAPAGSVMDVSLPFMIPGDVPIPPPGARTFGDPADELKLVNSVELVRLYRVAIPLKGSWGSAVARESSIETILVNLVAEGHSLWSEVTPHAQPIYTPECGGSVFASLRDFFIPELFKCESLKPSDVASRFTKFKGNHYARGAIDIALWNLEAKRRGVLLHQAIGATRDSTHVGEALGQEDSIDILLEKIQSAIDKGYARVKLKFGPGWDIAMLSVVRGSFPDFPLHIDCNGVYGNSNVGDLAKLDRFNLLMIEQPFAADNLLAHVALAKASRTPICIDESVTSLDVVKSFVTLGACHWVHLKPGRVGGLTAVKEIHDYCVSESVSCAIGSDLSSAIGEQVVVAASLLPGVRLATSAFPSGRLFDQELASEPLHFHRDGGFFVARGDQLREPRSELLEKWCLKKLELRPT